MSLNENFGSAAEYHLIVMTFMPPFTRGVHEMLDFIFYAEVRNHLQ